MNKRLLQQAIRANRLADEYDRLANKVVQQYVEAVCPLKSGMIISKRNQVNRIYYFYVDKIGGWFNSDHTAIRWTARVYPCTKTGKLRGHGQVMTADTKYEIVK